MKIKLIENEKPKIKKIEFSCDEEISPKLNKYPLVRDHLHKYNTTLLIGRQGSGKTSLTINILQRLYRKKFHKIYVFMPQTSRNSMKNNLFDVLPSDQLYEELNPDTILDVYTKLKQNSKKGEKSLIIYDDVQKSLKDYQVLLSLKNIIANQRHLKVVNFILAQNFLSVDPRIREIVNNLIFFKMDKKQSQKIFEDLIEMDEETYTLINDVIFDEPYNWCFINLPTKRVYKLFWDEIIMTKED
jgi:energy-coupling factor transporter ATP-binding protein EcfA2